ncbi:MAG TPA: M13 family metallopeptidase [Candidatus Acidoferrum sp.]|jgi:putative endopeptidase
MMLRRLCAMAGLGVAILAGAAMAFAGGQNNGSRGADDKASGGFDVANMDRTCKACDDFYKYANGGWMKKNTIPPQYPEWGPALIMFERTEQRLHEILEAAAANRSVAAGSNEQKIGDYYATCMDMKAIDEKGLKPLNGDLGRINAIHDNASLLETGARLQAQGTGVLFGYGSDQDFADSTQVIGEVRQGGLGLPDRDYYTRDDEKSKELRKQYVEHMTKMFVLMGDAKQKAAAEAQTVLGIETSLAKASLNNVDLRDPQKNYHKMSVADAQKLTPHWNWDAYFAAIRSAKLSDMNVSQPEFFKAMDGLLASVPLEDWKTYYRWQLIHRSARLLSDPFVQENFNFTGRELEGTTEMRVRWRRCSATVDDGLGEALGQVYVEKYFPPAAKARVLAMVRNLLAALNEDLNTLEWMSPETRKAAAEKLQAFALKIGYPDRWRDYSKLKIDRESYAGNAFRATEFENARDLAKIGKPVDHTEWGMSPPTINAYYNPQLNEIVFPAGILQGVIFDPDRDDSYNYGAIGSIIGHEITHGFDDQGAQFDPKGNLKNWWTEQDLKNFQGRGECIAKQFDGFEVEKGLHENGKLVEGESIADLGGLTISYAAFEKSMEGKPREKDANGFTPEQQFFLGYAAASAAILRPEFARLLANTDPHPLPEFRVNGPFSNMEAFQKAFGCKKGDPMVREDVCKIW